MRLLLLSIGLLASVMASAWAGCGTANRGEHCGYEPNAAKYYPDEAGRFGAGSAAYVCARDGVRTVGEFATPVASGEAGVCYFWIRDMTAKVPESAFPKRYLKMRVANGACPGQDDPGYIDNKDVPDGIFAALVTRWNAAGFAFPPLTAEGRKAGQLDFNAMLATPEGRKRLKLAAIYLDELGPDMEFESKTRATVADLVVTDSMKPSENYYFGVDWSNGDFRIVSVNYLITGC
jgi:hypothetical protein